jgi:hypothetical protein
VSIAPELSGRLKPGQKVPFSFPADKLHVFDAASGRRL